MVVSALHLLQQEGPQVERQELGADRYSVWHQVWQACTRFSWTLLLPLADFRRVNAISAMLRWEGHSYTAPNAAYLCRRSRTTRTASAMRVRLRMLTVNCRPSTFRDRYCPERKGFYE